MRKSFLTTIIAGLLIVAPASQIVAQVNKPEFANYLLVGRFGEICTMCEAILLCQEASPALDPDGIPAGGSFTLYHLQTRTFWSQISTIWEWFIANFAADSLARSGHSRPVIVHEITDSRWAAPRLAEAHLSLEPASIELDGKMIDRDRREWRSGAGDKLLGQCRRLPLWESLEVIEANGG